jgi:hypothetical protein
MPGARASYRSEDQGPWTRRSEGIDFDDVNGPGPVEAEGATTSYQNVLRNASLVVGHYQRQTSKG